MDMLMLAYSPLQPSFLTDFLYQSDLIDPEQQRAIISELERLNSARFSSTFEGKRRVFSFTCRYNFNGEGLQKSVEIPPFLMPLRHSAVRVVGDYQKQKFRRGRLSRTAMHTRIHAGKVQRTNNIVSEALLT